MKLRDGRAHLIAWPIAIFAHFSRFIIERRYAAACCDERTDAEEMVLLAEVRDYQRFQCVIM